MKIAIKTSLSAKWYMYVNPSVLHKTALLFVIFQLVLALNILNAQTQELLIDVSDIQNYDYLSALSEKPPNDLAYVEAYTNKVIELANNHGYPFASASVKPLHFSEDSIKIKIIFDPGILIKWIDVETDEDVIRPSFLRRYLNIIPGQPYSARSISKIPEKMARIPYFQMDNNATVQFQNEGALVKLNGNKYPSSSFNGIVGLMTEPVSNDLIITGQVDLELNNLFRSGKSFDAHWQQLNSNSPYFNTSYFHPYFAGSPISLRGGFSLLKQDSSFISREAEFLIQFDLSSRQTISAKYANYYSFGLESESDIEIPRLNNNQYGLVYKYERSNRYFSPTSAEEIMISATAGSKRIDETASTGHLNINGNAKIIRETSMSVPLVFFNKLSAGILISDSLYVSELFRLGGFNTLRGFNENFFFAEQYLINQTEIRLPFDDFSYLLAFFDFGLLTLQNMDDFPYATGIGFNIRNQNGIFQVIYAIGASQDLNFTLEQSKIHFGYKSIF